MTEEEEAMGVPKSLSAQMRATALLRKGQQVLNTTISYPVNSKEHVSTFFMSSCFLYLPWHCLSPIQARHREAEYHDFQLPCSSPVSLKSKSSPPASWKCWEGDEQSPTPLNASYLPWKYLVEIPPLLRKCQWFSLLNCLLLFQVPSNYCYCLFVCLFLT